MTVDIIIPNYNGAKLYEKNLPEVIKAHEAYKGRIIVVDDGSSDDDKTYLRRVISLINNPKVVLVEHKFNKGFSSAINTGVSKSKSEFVVLLNSDVVPRKDFLKSPLFKIENDKSIFAIGCMDESVEGDKIVERGRGLGYWHKGMLLHKRGEVDQEDTFWVSGGSCVIRRNYFVELGGMDEIFNPFYWEDIDLSYRARKSGYKVMFDKNSVVKHYHEEGAIKKSFSSKRITKTAYRNQFIFIWKNINSTHLLLNHFLYLPIHFLHALKNSDSAFVMGLFLAVGRLPDIMKKRNLQKRHYKISDVNLLDHIS